MTNRAAARRYARALFDVSLKEADVQVVERELSAFVDLVQQHPDLARVVATPAVPAPRKRALVTALLERGEPISPVLAKLLVLLAERDRLVLLPDLLAAYGERVLDHRRVVRAEVTTAVPLPAERAERLRQMLAHATGREVLLDPRVDPALIGGAVTRIGSIVIDGSVARQLERMKERIGGRDSRPLDEP
jgi:F-type H+-transporting ATPase subunit delta